MHSLPVELFLKYVTFDTQSIPGTGKVPSSEGQMVFAKYLAQELKDMGLSDVSYDEHAYVYATLPSNNGGKAPVFALIAHTDTALEVSGKNVKPRVVRYEGGDIILNEELGIKTTACDFPDLEEFIGKEIIVTDGTTLLGADDKSGIAAIVAAAKWYVDNPGEKHGTVKLVFTPDEEIGHGASLIDIEKLGSDFAYTVDGGNVGETCWETFNAAAANVTFKGKAVHPGTAKNKLKNASLMMMDFIQQLPPEERPESTEEREGFFMCFNLSGNVEQAHLNLMVRDHDLEKFKARKEFVLKIAQRINEKYGEGSCNVVITEMYPNMGNVLKDKMYIVEYLNEAIRATGIEPYAVAMRGGTDGSQLTSRGLPTPNLFMGNMNAHSRNEYLPVHSLEKSCEVIKNLIRMIGEKG